MNEMVNAYRSNKAAAAEYASPHQLIGMLFDGALERLARAIGHAERGEVAAKGECIGRVVMILDSLQASLDQAAGDGQIAGNLSDLYDYMMRRLTEANLRSDPAMMTEVHQLLNGLADAWRAIAPEAAADVAPSTAGADETLRTSGTA
ncbi:MAG: flagellar export chaperone FliS [Chromatocurvus sp.]